MYGNGLPRNAGKCGRESWSIGGMQSLFSYKENGKRNLVWEPTFYLQKQITKPWDVFAEYASDFAQRGGSKEVVHFGTAYKITSTNQVDFHVGYGLSLEGASAADLVKIMRSKK